MKKKGKETHSMLMHTARASAQKKRKGTHIIENKQTNERTNERTNEPTNQRTNEPTNQRTNERTNANKQITGKCKQTNAGQM